MTKPSHSAYVPDLPTCVATGVTLGEVEQQIREAIEFHLDGMREDGEPIPAPSIYVEYVESPDEGPTGSPAVPVRAPFPRAASSRSTARSAAQQPRLQQALNVAPAVDHHQDVDRRFHHLINDPVRLE